MASVNFEKLKLPQQVKAMLYHCDKETRLAAEHSNIDIDKSVTLNNTQGNLDFYAAYKRYTDRIAELDQRLGANKRKDRVTCFGLNIPTPKDLKPEDEDAFFKEVLKIIAAQYGGFANVVQYFVHRDERHRYVNSETGETCWSRTHLHCYVIPEHNGKLNGKWFSNRSNMVKLNNSIHEMAQEQFNVSFMDGSKKKSRKTVEQLKNESVFLEVQKEMEEQKASLDTRKGILDAREDELDAKEDELQEKEEMLEQREKEVQDLEEQKETVRQKLAAVKQKEDDLDEAVRAVTEMPTMDEAMDYILDHASIEIQAIPGSPCTFPFIARRYLEHIRETQKKEVEIACKKVKKKETDDGPGEMQFYRRKPVANGEAVSMQFSEKANAEPARKKSTRRVPEYAFSVAQPDDGMEF